ncbi:putative ATP/GTP-binding protein [Fusobacterium phage vB_FnuS_FNU3]|uniref:ATP/GTP-binding protein n=1 Tax=Fusobacterium phage Fnu1 TaxID=2530024 RepID=A0A481W5W9_9CAUD|nr:ATP/GTP-binding protein [Fusobacterium phage Fnu1]QBJ04096.1 ATP/GTP-binding protein [Fusobacterium phage Fnu1]WGH50225.1 putative ATP/GTP-binding protein [Fusobacterium phage vB_FnuS_FNU2]WGH50370.1 putative ATP/GTP-binding protein [Fusobacterium phage vB_FnuS_FNU3]
MKSKIDIEYINILGLFGERDVKLDFTNLVNIFIGENGCGKTVVLNILRYIFQNQIYLLGNINFKEIQIKFKNENVINFSRQNIIDWKFGQTNGYLHIVKLRKLIQKYNLHKKVIFLSTYRQFENNFYINNIKPIKKEINNFITTCEKFLYNKKIEYKNFQGTINDLKIKYKDNIIKGENLSHGEKQIISIFSKIYFNKEQDIIVLIDDPEISLNINWQKELIPNIVNTKKIGLLIAMTHSPFIFENEYFDECTKELIK